MSEFDDLARSALALSDADDVDLTSRIRGHAAPALSFDLLSCLVAGGCALLALYCYAPRDTTEQQTAPMIAEKLPKPLAADKTLVAYLTTGSVP